MIWLSVASIRLALKMAAVELLTTTTRRVGGPATPPALGCGYGTISKTCTPDCGPAGAPVGTSVEDRLTTATRTPATK